MTLLDVVSHVERQRANDSANDSANDERSLESAGGKLSDIVTITAFITDDRYDRRFLEIRKEIFGDNFPASAMINIRSLARPELLIEIQSVAMIG